MRRVYLDYAATTPVKQEVLDAMLPYFCEKFGNPSSLYEIGLESRSAIDVARGQVARLIGADLKEVYFTSSGTEADNWAVTCGARFRKNKGNHIITTEVEHHALLHTAQALEKEGFQVTYLKPDKNGMITVDDLKAAMTDQTILVSIMMANNEIGTLYPIKEMAAAAKEKGVLFHTDAVQALGNLHIDVKDLGVDMLSISAHKIYGPKGVGALYIRKGLALPPFLHGGAQENKRRSGTENLTGIVGFGKAAELAGEALDEHIENITNLRNDFLNQLKDRVEDIEVNGGMENRLPGNVNIIFNYIEGEALLLHLDSRHIYASTGSACSSASFSASHVLAAIGVPIEKAYSSIRFTLGDFTTKEDVDYAVQEITAVVNKLRSISPFNKDRRMEETTQVIK